MKELKYSVMKLLNARDMLKSPCLKLTSDGETIGYIIIKPQGAMVERIEAIASQIDASKGFK